MMQMWQLMCRVLHLIGLVGNLKGIRVARSAFARPPLCRPITGVSIVTPTQLSVFVRFPQMDCGALTT